MNLRFIRKEAPIRFCHDEKFRYVPIHACSYLLVKSILRSDVKVSICRGLLKLVIVIEVSPNLHSTLCTSQEELLLRQG